jgi:hypothetical protein
MPDMLHNAQLRELNVEFLLLRDYVGELDADAGAQFLPRLQEMGTADLLSKTSSIEEYAMRLNSSEVHEFRRGRVLDLFGTGSAAEERVAARLP